MNFPVYLGFGALKVHPHPLFEAIAYSVALRLSLRNFRQDVIPGPQRAWIVVGGLVGALIGAKLLVILQHLNVLVNALDWQELWRNPAQLRGEFGLLLIQGKTVVGALLGALFGVELTKKSIGVRQATGDAFVFPLLWGTAIGRIGCFLTGLSDQTYGIATQLPWGVDFGDGVLRHPTQLYEIVFLLGLAVFLRWRSRQGLQSGDLFKIYMVSYLGFRFVIDFIKPDFRPFLQMSAIQIACLLALGYYRNSFVVLLPGRRSSNG